MNLICICIYKLDCKYLQTFASLSESDCWKTNVQKSKDLCNSYYDKLESGNIWSKEKNRFLFN